MQPSSERRIRVENGEKKPYSYSAAAGVVADLFDKRIESEGG